MSAEQEKLEKQLRTLKARLSNVKAKERSKTRKLDARRKIILGSLINETEAKNMFNQLSDRDQEWMRKHYPNWAPPKQAWSPRN